VQLAYSLPAIFDVFFWQLYLDVTRSFNTFGEEVTLGSRGIEHSCFMEMVQVRRRANLTRPALSRVKFTAIASRASFYDIGMLKSSHIQMTQEV
jgi:hypothetical protein